MAVTNEVVSMHPRSLKNKMATLRWRLQYKAQEAVADVGFWLLAKSRPETNYVKHLDGEIAAAGWDMKDEENQWMARHLRRMCYAFAAEGHSGHSAQYALAWLKKVLAFEPCTPLTGKDEEWVEYEERFFQNKRCPHVFRDPRHFGGKAYDSEGIVWVDERGAYTNSASAVPITFPYTPTREERPASLDPNRRED